MTIHKRKIHEVWKGRDGQWKVQCPKGRLSYKLKRDANGYANAAKELKLK